MPAFGQLTYGCQRGARRSMPGHGLPPCCDAPYTLEALMAVAMAWMSAHASPWSSMFKRLLGTRQASTPERTAPGEQRASGPSADEMLLVEQLRAGDESAFTMLVTVYYPAMLRVALMYVSSRAVAEDVIQETWLGVLQGIGRFEGRSSLKTWIFRILANTAKTRAQREGRSIPFSSLADPDAEGSEPVVDPD